MISLKSTLTAGALTLAVLTGGIGWASSAAAAPTDQTSAPGSQTLAALTTVTETPTVDEADGLAFMREEEKLARDVYLTLYDVWGSRVFSNIARSEQNHMDAVGTLLARYDIEDPAASTDIGEFTNQDLQALYDTLVDLGSDSLADALAVGALIEETDIEDLINELATVEHSDIQTVYQRLLAGSNNHLRAFTSTLARQTGVTYEPQVLDQQTYDDIVSASTNSAAAGQRGRMNRR